MKKTVFLLSFFFVSISLWSQQKYALVIGNNDYRGTWSYLNNPVNDATDMGEALNSLGFEVDLICDGNLDQMERAVINLGRKLAASRNSYGFFFYAGHGAQYNNDNYLLPVDAITPSLNLLVQRAMSLSFVLKELEMAGNELNMIVLDACRNLPDDLLPLSQRGVGSYPQGLSPVAYAPRGSIIMYATAANSSADDGIGRNGLFTSHLLRNLTTPELEVSEVFRRTGSDVARATEGKQYPETRYMYFESAYLGSRPSSVPSINPTPLPIPPVPAPGVTVPANFVFIEGGSFRMGNDDGDDDERPIHTVTLKSFMMSKYPVTQKEYQDVMGVNPSFVKRADNPVENVSWFDAIEYCNKRSQLEGLTPAYRGSGSNITCDWNANGYRLPTEAEWEYAAKGGSSVYLLSTYSGSNNADAVAWYNLNSWSLPRPVGTKLPNTLGLYDMSGNVWEWCWDWYGRYSGASVSDPVGVSTGENRVIRGGSYNYPAYNLRSDYRGVSSPSFRNTDLGFRVVRR